LQFYESFLRKQEGLTICLGHITKAFPLIRATLTDNRDGEQIEVASYSLSFDVGVGEWTAAARACRDATTACPNRWIEAKFVYIFLASNTKMHLASRSIGLYLVCDVLIRFSGEPSLPNERHRTSATEIWARDSARPYISYGQCDTKLL